MKEYKKLIIATTLITLLPIILGLILWNQLPDTIATHWGADGQADGWSSKTFAIIGLPLILTAIHLFTVLFTLNDPRRKNIHKKASHARILDRAGHLADHERNCLSHCHGRRRRRERDLLCPHRDSIYRTGKLYAEASAELHCRHKDSLDAEQRGELEPHSPAGRQALYHRRYPHDPRRIQREPAGGRRHAHLDIREHYLMCHSPMHLFLLAVPQRSLTPPEGTIIGGTA